MNEKQLNDLLENPKLVDEKIDFYIKNKILFRQEFDMSEIAKRRKLCTSVQGEPAISEHAQEHAPPFRAAVLDKAEMKGHIQKAEHNSSFIQDTLKQNYTDWAIVGCYYASYHIALALLLKKGFSSKNHDATLCVLIKYYHGKELSKEDIELINRIYLDNNDILFYVQSKQEREKASYSSQIVFDKKLVNELKLKTLLFVNKGKEIIDKS